MAVRFGRFKTVAEEPASAEAIYTSASSVSVPVAAAEDPAMKWMLIALLTQVGATNQSVQLKLPHDPSGS